MIQALTGLFRVGAGTPVRRFVWLVIAYGIAQGCVFLTVIPVIGAVVSGDVAAAWLWGGVLIGGAAIATLLFTLQARCGYRTSLQLSQRLQLRIGDHVARLPLGWFDRARTGELAQLTVGGTERVGSITAHLLQPVVSAVVSPLVVVIGLFIWAPQVAGVGLLFLPVAAIVGWWGPKLTARQDAAVERHTVEVNEQVVDFALAQPVLRSAGRGVGSYEPLDGALEGHFRAQVRGLWMVVPGQLANSVMVQLWLIGLLATTLALTLSGAVAVPAAVGLVIVSLRFVGPLLELSEYASAIRGAGDSLAAIERLLGTPVLPEPELPVLIPHRELAVELSDVSFGYDGRQVLNGVSFVAAPGTFTALVGPSGAGKTTMLRLIARFWDTGSGSVSIGGHDVRAVGSDAVIDRVALVFQDVYLFEGSILENVRFGRPDASDAEVLEAIRVARVQEIADRLPDGLDTAVGEGGTRLSGGERQRVSIARALLKNAPIVLLDEATAALDAENEAALAEAFRALAAGRTVIAIAHRLETIREATEILVLEHGGIVERGSHEALMSEEGRYADFWRAKERAANWTVGGAVRE